MKTSLLLKLTLVALVGALALPAGAATTSADFTTMFTGTANKTAYFGATDMSIIPATGFGTNLIGAKRLKVGDQIQLALSGVAQFGSNNAANTLQIKVKAGAYTIANTQPMLLSSNSTAVLATDPHWDLTFKATCRTNGATGFLIGEGVFRCQWWANHTNVVTYQVTNDLGLVVGTTTNFIIDVTAKFADPLGYGAQTNRLTTQNCWIGLTR